MLRLFISIESLNGTAYYKTSTWNVILNLTVKKAAVGQEEGKTCETISAQLSPFELSLMTTD